jgi:DNA-directed RNA polymerase subunit L
MKINKHQLRKLIKESILKESQELRRSAQFSISDPITTRKFLSKPVDQIQYQVYTHFYDNMTNKIDAIETAVERMIKHHKELKSSQASQIELSIKEINIAIKTLKDFIRLSNNSKKKKAKLKQRAEQMSSVDNAIRRLVIPEQERLAGQVTSNFNCLVENGEIVCNHNDIEYKRKKYKDHPKGVVKFQCAHRGNDGYLFRYNTNSDVNKDIKWLDPDSLDKVQQGLIEKQIDALDDAISHRHN